MKFGRFSWKFPLKFGYDAVETSPRRQTPRSDVQSEDDHLIPSKRRKLVSTVRDLKRNFSFAAWAIRKHLDYVSSFSFQSQNKVFYGEGMKELDDHIERLMKWWSLKENFDVRGMHSLSESIRLAEACRVTDGDVFLYKLKAGMVQGVEGDLIAKPTSGVLPSRYKAQDFEHGIKRSPAGKPLSYAVNKRVGNHLEFHKVVSARHMIHFAYWDRFDQIRGVSPLASAITTMQDAYESVVYALGRAKISQLFGLVMNRASAEAVGEVSGGGTKTEGDDKSEYKVDFGKGPFILDFDHPDDDAKFIDSNQPSSEFVQFFNATLALALKALDIPFSFYDESFTNYSGARQALLLYEQSAAEKRKAVKAVLDALTRWRIMLWIASGVLKLPAGITISDIRWDWQPSGIPWVDPLKETMADKEAVDGALNSRRRILRKQGIDVNEVFDELEQEQNEIEKRGIGPAASTGISQVIQH